MQGIEPGERFVELGARRTTDHEAAEPRHAPQPLANGERDPRPTVLRGEAHLGNRVVHTGTGFFVPACLSPWTIRPGIAPT